jgi:hypothetical protein
MATSSRDMSDMMRGRRKQMMSHYTGPEDEAEAEDSPKEEAKEKSLTVAAPGEPSTGDTFEYEPLTDMPGAWVVYPPGVPCDENEYRVQMDRPAGVEDFAAMQEALDEAGATNPEPAEPALDEEEGAY